MNKKQAFQVAKSVFPELKPVVPSGFSIGEGVVMIPSSDQVLVVRDRDLCRLASLAMATLNDCDPDTARVIAISIGSKGNNG
jgi:hypothetical protein